MSPRGPAPRKGPALVVLMFAAALVAQPTRVHAQGRGAPPPTAKASAPFDLTGYWVSFVTEDWRFRMVTPPKGDYRGIPITKEALQIVNAWDPAADEASGNQCKSYGAGIIMRVPGRIRVTWQDDNTLRLESDAGSQTRLFRFAPFSPSKEKTWQGDSTARWEGAGGGGRGAAQGPRGGTLTVMTTNVRAGYLRKNGVPYSEDARITEHFDFSPGPGGPMLVVTTVVDDPRYLTQPFIVSSHFKREANGSKWDPTPCSASW